MALRQPKWAILGVHLDNVIMRRIINKELRGVLLSHLVNHKA